MTDIFSEIDEDIRRERLKKVWERFAPLIIALGVLIVLGVAAWRGWVWYAERRAHEAGTRFEAAMALARDNKPEEARTAFTAIAKGAPWGYAFLARFRAAAAQAATDRPGAVQAYDALGSDSAVPQPARDLAKVRAALLLLDSAGLPEITARVETLAAPGQPWRHSAREILALAAWKAGDIAATRKWAEMLLGDPEVPAAARQHGQVLIDLAAGADAGSPPPAATPAP